MLSEFYLPSGKINAAMGCGFRFFVLLANTATAGHYHNTVYQVAERPTPDTIWLMDISSKPRVNLSVSIVLYNSNLLLLQRTLQSLQESARVAGQAGCLHRVSVFLIDNASHGQYQTQLAELVARWPCSESFVLRISVQPRNRGFGHGHNAVPEPLTSDYHLVLNPDVELQGDTLRSGLLALTASDDIVLLSPKVFGKDGEQEFLCKRYPSVLVLLLRGFGPPFLHGLFRKRLAAYEMRDECGGEVKVDVDIASGCFLLVRTAALRATGGFDEDFFLYFEDFDLSLRMKSQGRLVFDPSMCIVHHGGYAASKGWQHLKYFVASGFTFFNRYGWRWI